MIIDRIGTFHIGYNGIAKFGRCWSINADGWVKDYSASYYCKKIIEHIEINEEKYKI